MARDAELQFFYRTASHLGKSVIEVMDLPIEELTGWRAYFALEAEQKGMP